MFTDAVINDVVPNYQFFFVFEILFNQVLYYLL